MMTDILTDITIEDLTITEADDDMMATIKGTILSMKRMEQRILLTYINEGTYAATAREFNVTPPTAKAYISRLRDKILTALIENNERTEVMLDAIETYDDDIS